MLDFTLTQVIALTSCLSGVGKDTIANRLVEQGYNRMSFGDYLRQDVIDAYGKPACEDERSTDCYPEFGMSLKDLMLSHGAKVAITDPLRYAAQLHKDLSSQLRYSSQPVVITDMRKPVEMLAIAQQELANVYFIKVKSKVRGEGKRLDGLLGDHCETYSKYKDVLMPALPYLHGTINNNGTVDDVIAQLSSILERTVPGAVYFDPSLVSDLV